MAQAANVQYYVSPIADPIASDGLNKKILRITKKCKKIDNPTHKALQLILNHNFFYESF